MKGNAGFVRIFCGYIMSQGGEDLLVQRYNLITHGLCMCARVDSISRTCTKDTFKMTEV